MLLAAFLHGNQLLGHTIAYIMIGYLTKREMAKIFFILYRLLLADIILI